MDLNKKKLSHYEKLSKKWIKRQVASQEKLWEKHKSALIHIQDRAKQMAVSSLAGFLLLIPPVTSLPTPSVKIVHEKPIEPKLSNEQSFLVDLSENVPEEVRSLTAQEEAKITQIITDHTGIAVSAELQGIRLNANYGYIGKEQFLARTPDDTLWAHLTTPDEIQKFANTGMAPGLGAWGYFEIGPTLTPDAIARERYYIAVQTFLTSGYNDNVQKYSDFFKWRKVLVVNPQNGRTIVADIGDSGPAVWTGKQLGGSPVVMDYLQRVDGAQKGPVLYFFIDDPLNKIPLGPVQI